MSAIPGASVRDTLLESVKDSMKLFAEEYERIRSTLPSGKSRTKAMNAVAAKMRTLAIAAPPFLNEFVLSFSPGERLAAICILEISPDFAYLDWLVDRMRVETPFIFFHSSLALLAMVTKFGFEANAQLTQALEKALQIVNSYLGGEPDLNTVRVLYKGLEELHGVAENSDS